MNFLHISPRHCLILCVVLIIFPSVRGYVLLDALYHITPLQGTALTLFHTKNEVWSIGRCATECAREWTSSQRCMAFVYDQPGQKCDFYKTGDNYTISQNVQAHLLQGIGLGSFERLESTVKDRFQTVSVSGKRFSILLSSSNTNYEEARTYCNGVGGYLLEYDSLEENEAVSAIVINENINAWVGANDIAERGRYVTDRAGTALNTSVWLWRENEPNNLDERCVAFSINNHGLIDADCSMSFQSLCERDLNL